MATEPYTLTKIDVAALRQADYLFVQFGADRADVRCTKRKEKTAQNPYAQDVDHYIPAPVGVYSSWRLDISQARCTALVYLYHAQTTPSSSIIRTLRAGDAIRFDFHADYHSTEAFRTKTGFHADALLLSVYDAKGHKVAEWELAQSICEENSARMCRGVTRKPEYSLA